MRSILAGPGDPGQFQGSRSRNGAFAPLACAAALAVSAVACEKVPLLAPGLSTITLSASSTIVQTNGTVEIRATVLEQSGTPVQNGTTVTFSTNLGTMEPREAQTVNGTATARFVANGQSGEAEIRAASGAAKPDTTNPSIKIKVGAAAAARVQVSASPNRVSASGGSSTITATVSDTNSNPLSGVAVAFTADAGSLSSSVATTSSTGGAQVTLTTTRDATITATTGPGSGTAIVSGTVKVSVSSLPRLTLTVTPGTLLEDQPVTLTLTAAAAAISNPSDPFQSVVVDFGDGASQPIAIVEGGTVPLSHTYRSDGTFVVRVTGTGFNGDTTSAFAIVVISSLPNFDVTITVTGTQQVNRVLDFSAAVSVPNIDHYEWTWGDGNAENNGSRMSHIYTAPNNYTVRVRAVATNGATGSGQKIVQIAP